MRTFTHPHTSDRAAELYLSVPHGVIELLAEPRADITVTLAPVDSGDQVAADLIERASTSLRVNGTVYAVDVPEPAATTFTGATFSGATVVNGATIINGGIVAGVFYGGVVNHGSRTIINGQVVTGPGVTGGAVRAVVRVPVGARVELATTSADAHVSGPLAAVLHHSVSGSLRSTGTVGYLDARTVSGSVTAPAVDHANIDTTSGAVRLTLTGNSAEVATVSARITIHTTTDAHIDAHSVSGAITVTQVPGTRVRTTARSVSGRVRTGD